MPEHPEHPAGGPLALCALDDITDGGARGFAVERANGRHAIFVVRRGAEIFGYVNRCPHTGVFLEWVPDQFLSPDGDTIQCATHGARFRIEDGLCIHGPCNGESLTPVAVAVHGGQVRLLSESVDAEPPWMLNPPSADRRDD